MGGKKLLLLLVLAVCVVGVWRVAAAQEGVDTRSYLDAATSVIQENNRIDEEIADLKKHAYVTIRPVHVDQRLKKVNKDAYAIWPSLFVKEVPDKYADLYLNLQKLIKLQMKRTCLLYDYNYYGWMNEQDSPHYYENLKDRDKALQCKKELKRVECDYFKQKEVVESAYETVKKDY